MSRTIEVYMALIGAMGLILLSSPRGFPAEIPELHPTAKPIGDKPVAPRDVIPVPVIPDKMAVPAPTVADEIKQATPPAEMPGAATGSGAGIPDEERKEVAPIPTAGVR